MGIVDLEVELTEEEIAVRETVHRFAAEVLRPIGKLLDAMPDPKSVIDRASPLWEAHDKFRKLGLDLLEMPPSPSEAIRQARLRAIIYEELGWGDAGLAISLTVSDFHRMFAELSGREALIERFCGNGNGHVEIGCWAITEPDHGSDALAFSEPGFADRRIRANCVARRSGDEWVISGQKSAWVSNGTIADVASLFCTVEPEQGFQGGGVALVPLDRAGVVRGRPLDKLGQRPLNQGEIVFEDVRIPAEYMVVGPEAYAGALEAVLTLANAGMGTLFVGLARAAVEHAVAYAKERVQGGRPIFEHQSVKARLFRMFSQFEAARALARRVMIYNAANPPLIQYSIASKVFCTQTAFDVASGALQIFGGNGLTREYPIEKLLRDARASMIEDGCNDLLGLIGASRL